MSLRSVGAAAFSLALIAACSSVVGDPRSRSQENIGQSTSALNVSLSRWYKVPLRESDLNRDGHAMAYDALRHRVVLFGGAEDSGQNATWLWDGTSWARATPAAWPQGTLYSVMTFDALHGNVVLFGGSTLAGYVRETWLWNGTNWARAATPTSPPGREEHAMAFDPAHGNVVMFGGRNESGLMPADTWLFDGSDWSKANPALSPPVTDIGAHMVYDAARGTMLYVAPNAVPGPGVFFDTWTWSGTAWTKLAPATKPPATEDSTLAYDSVRGRVVLFGGLTYDINANPVYSKKTWTWNGTTWASVTTSPAPPGRERAQMVFDTMNGNTVLFGGVSGPDQTRLDSTTWLWNGAAWSIGSAPQSPVDRDSAGLAYDSTRKKVVLFGGYDAAGNDYRDTWTWDGTAWTRLSPALSPDALGAGRMVYDAERGQVVLQQSSPSTRTWLWDGTTWTLASTPSAPPARDDFGLAYDSARKKVVLFGGDSSGTKLADTWTWDGSTWTQLTPSASPSPRSAAGMVYDAKRGVTLLFGGDGSVGPLDDVWTFDGVTWKDVTPITRPSARSTFAFAYDGTGERTLLFSGFHTALADTWQWDGTGFMQIVPGTSPASRSGAPMIYDEVRRQMVLFGGLGNGQSGAETWLFVSPGTTCRTSAECAGGLTCVDGACCLSTSCGSCESCNGLSPGECAPVLNAPDPDTCSASDNKSCSDLGECKAALGQPATTATACASGFMADGVCCNQACDHGCVSCRADLKQSGSLSGICDSAKAGSDPHDACAEEIVACGHDGTCDARGGCAFRAKNSPCGAVACVDARATGLICDGSGHCSASAVGVACGVYGCTEAKGCNTQCATNADCAARSHCDSVTHACLPDAAAACDGQHALVSPDGTRTECDLYLCKASACPTTCDSLFDCVGGATCTFDHHCVIDSGAIATSDSGGCNMHASPNVQTGRSAIFWGGLLALGIVLRSRRRAGGAR